MVPGSNLSYGHIVHIGLSFGIIQFTQDSGGLGKLLQRMQGKDRNKFSKIFGDNCDELVKLTTVGIEVPNVDYQSGQAHWNSIRHTSRGAHLTGLAAHNPLPKSSEIRGKRVQPIATTLGGPKQDLWEGVWKQRFKDAGNVDAFQEAELDFAVEGYMNPVLALCKQKNVRSALGIAFITACAVRGANKQVLMMAAKVCGLAVPFTSGSDEKVALEYIAKLDPAHPNSIGGIAVQKDEIVRARVILKDETGFLAEDHYDPDTYSHQFDN